MWGRERDRREEKERERERLSRQSPPHRFLWCPAGPSSFASLNLLLEVPLLYSPSPRCPQAVPTAWDGICVHSCFLSYSLPWREFLSGWVTLICLTRPGIFLLFPPYFFRRLHSGMLSGVLIPSLLPLSRSDINSFLLSICACCGISSCGNVLLWQCFETNWWHSLCPGRCRQGSKAWEDPSGCRWLQSHWLCCQAAPLVLLQDTNHLLMQIFCALPCPDSELPQKTQSSFRSPYPLEVSLQKA